MAPPSEVTGPDFSGTLASPQRSFFVSGLALHHIPCVALRALVSISAPPPISSHPIPLLACRVLQTLLSALSKGLGYESEFPSYRKQEEGGRCPDMILTFLSLRVCAVFQSREPVRAEAQTQSLKCLFLVFSQTQGMHLLL